MHQVAEYLSSEAKHQNGADADAFARSAFNRYYYAAFLSVRDLLSSIDSKWGGLPHSGLPDILEKTLVERVRKQAKNLQKTNVITESRQHALTKQASQASTDIASILRIAYNVRVVADYKPEQFVIFNHSDFELVKHTRAEARNWKLRVDQAKGTLLRISKELGLVI